MAKTTTRQTTVPSCISEFPVVAQETAKLNELLQRLEQAEGELIAARNAVGLPLDPWSSDFGAEVIARQQRVAIAEATLTHLRRALDVQRAKLTESRQQAATELEALMLPRIESLMQEQLTLLGRAVEISDRIRAMAIDEFLAASEGLGARHSLVVLPPNLLQQIREAEHFVRQRLSVPSNRLRELSG